MRKLPYQFGTSYDSTPVQDPWRRRMPAQIYIGPDLSRFAPTVQPLTFGKRRQQPTTITTGRRRSSLARLVSLFQGPRKTRRTKLR
jgi:hypothetical protein